MKPGLVENMLQKLGGRRPITATGAGNDEYQRRSLLLVGQIERQAVNRMEQRRHLPLWKDIQIKTAHPHGLFLLDFVPEFHRCAGYRGLEWVSDRVDVTCE